jgi:hypothetical protein
MMGILHHSEPYHVTKEEIEEARIGTGTRRLAFESAIATLNVPTGQSIRPGRRKVRKIRERGKQRRQAKRARRVGREETAAAASIEEARADRGSAA